MKLLPPNAAKRQKNSDEQRLSQRRKGLEDAVNMAVHDFNQVRRAIAEETDRISAEFMEFSAKKEAEKAQLTAEVELLEERRRKALEPMNAEAERLEGLLQKLVSEQEKSLQQSEMLKAERERLENLEDSLIKREKALKEGEIGLEQSQARLARQIRSFERGMSEKAASFERRSMLLSLREQEAEGAHKRALAEIEATEAVRKDLERDKTQLRAYEGRLESRKQGLQAAWKEIRKWRTRKGTRTG